MVAKVTTNLREAILGSVTMNSLEHKGLHVIESVAHYTRYGIADVHTHTHTHTHTGTPLCHHAIKTRRYLPLVFHASYSSDYMQQS